VDKLVNLAALREEALEMLSSSGSIGCSEVERVYVAGVLYALTENEDDPLFQAAQYDLEELGMGKYEFVLSWLSPYHLASSHPAAMADIGLVLLGRKPIPPKVLAQIHRILN
jgi:hypothetical protein